MFDDIEREVHRLAVFLPSAIVTESTVNAPVLSYSFAHTQPEGFAELADVRLLGAARTDSGIEVPEGTEGTVVGVWPGCAAYEVEFEAGLATVEASRLAGVTAKA